jgi:arylformamidase
MRGSPTMLIDISPPLSPQIVVWPGDRPFACSWSSRLRNGDSCNVGAVSMSLHTGAHADAPYHFLEEGDTVDAVALDRFVGPCTVVDLSGCARIDAADAARAARPGARLLFKTRSDSGGGPFPERFAHFTPEAAEALARAGVLLVGLDTPSVDAFDSKTLDAHKALARGGVAVLEGLDLSRAEAGEYELIALPLRLEGMDASPVRAVLRR